MHAKIVTVVRHGQSKSQTGEVFSLDPDLSTLGEEQARSLRKVLAGRSFDHIRVSPLIRAARTYELSGAESDDVAFDSRIVESTLTPESNYDYSPLLPYRALPVARPDIYDAWNEAPSARIGAFVRHLKTLPGRSILLFGHCGIFHILRCYLLDGEDENADLYSYEPSVILRNTAIGRFAIGEDGAGNELLSWNETPHLADFEPAEYLTR